MPKKAKAIAEVRQLKHEPLMDQQKCLGFEDETEIPCPENEYGLLRKLCEFYFAEKRYDLFQRLTFSSLGSPVFNKSESIMKKCEFLCLVASFANGDTYHAYNFVRDMVVKDTDNNRLWNLFNLVIR